MAASSEDNDYVHLVMTEVRKIVPSAEYKIAWAVAWEREYWCDIHLVAFREFVSFKPDIVIVNINENVDVDRNTIYPYGEYYNALLDYLNPVGKTKMILCTGFWKRGVLDEAVREIAAEREYPLAELNQLDTGEMKAIGQFSKAVNNHPGDKGMRAIADVILEPLISLVQDHFA